MLGYFLLSLLEGLGLRAVRDALPGNPVAQERIAGATLTAMAIADVSIQSVPHAQLFSGHDIDSLAINETSIEIVLHYNPKIMAT